MANASLIQSLDDNPNIDVGRAQDQVHSIDYLMQPWTPDNESDRTASQVAHEYLTQIATQAYGIPPEFLQESSSQPTTTAGLSDAPPGLELSEERPRFKSTTVTYQQTLLGLPVWNADVRITLNGEQEVIHSMSNFRPAATEVKKPREDAKFLRDVNANELGEALSLNPGDDTITINFQRLIVYRYKEDNRQPSVKRGQYENAGHSPRLPLHSVPSSIHDDQYYVAREFLFTLAHLSHGELNWRAFIEVETGTVLYLRARIADAVTGSVFSRDPITRKGNPSPGFDLQKLNALREKVDLVSMTLVSEGFPQPLKGSTAEVKWSSLVTAESNEPVAEDPQKRATPSTTNHDFDGQVDSDIFAAANAYHHVSSLFSLFEQLGFKRSDLFGHTQFPVPVYHRSYSDLNASAEAGNGQRGSGGFRFGVVEDGSHISIAADFRVTAHEFGHALLWDAYGDPNFGFAHSAGDSLATISCDPISSAPDRFNSFPWVDIGRRHDRSVQDGWAWGGPKYQADDIAQYDREQILSTTMFRVYRAIGGDAHDADKKTQIWASRYALYLILGGIAGLTRKPATADIYVSAMMNADSGTVLAFPGGAVRKVIRWAFEVQGLYQPNPIPSPITTRGQPPQVDVYINDGRNGEYDYRANPDSPPDVWNRNAQDGAQGSQPAAAGRTNYIYVTVRNRGTDPAKNIRVKVYLGYQPINWDEKHSEFSELSLSTAISTAPLARNGALQVGPFPWTPNGSHAKPMVLVSVSADGDLSNIDPATRLSCAKGPTNLDKLVPFDNNLAMRYF